MQGRQQEDLILKRLLKLEADECIAICTDILYSLQHNVMPDAQDFENDFLHGIDK